MEKTELYLYGAGGHAKVVFDILKRQGREVSGFVADYGSVAELFGRPVLGALPQECRQLVLSVGSNAARKRLSEKQLEFLTAIHPEAVVSEYAELGEGTVVMAGALVNPGVTVGRHCILNTGCIIEHDNRLEDFVHVSPGAALAGTVHVGEGTHIGTNATVIPGIRIGKWATVGAGAVIIEDVPDYAVVVGNPAKIIKYNPNGEK